MLFRSTLPLQALLATIAWRDAMAGLAAIALGVSALVFIAAPERGGGGELSLQEQLAGVRRAFSAPLFWRIMPVTVLTHGMFLAYQSLWAAPWLEQVAGLGDPDFEVSGVRQSRAGGLGRAFDLGGVLRFQILEPDRVGGVSRAEEVDAVETLGGDRVEGLAVEGRGIPQERLQTLESLVLGLQKNQRVAQDCLGVLSAPYCRRNLRLACHRGAVDGRSGLVPVPCRPLRLATVLRISLLHPVR